MPYEISKSFVFDAAHQLGANVGPGHRYGNLHGHSFSVELGMTGDPDPQTGWIRDFAELEAAAEGLRARLDHKYLNEIEGLERPTLERIATWIWDRLKPDFPELSRVAISRGSCREACVYTGPRS